MEECGINGIALCKQLRPTCKLVILTPKGDPGHNHRDDEHRGACHAGIEDLGLLCTRTGGIVWDYGSTDWLSRTHPLQREHYADNNDSK